MYAVIRTGGKQYKVQAGDVLQVEKLEQALGTEFDINEVLLLGGDTTVVGQPLVKNAKVTCVVTKQARTRKVLVFKKRRRHSFRKFNTHKQDFTELFIKSITSPDGKVEKTDATPVVKDMAAVRVDRVKAKQAARKERVEAAIGKKEPVVKAAKKVAKKATVKKATKKAPAKKATAKKAVKKTVKKATKKA